MRLFILCTPHPWLWLSFLNKQCGFLSASLCAAPDSLLPLPPPILLSTELFTIQCRANVKRVQHAVTDKRRGYYKNAFL